MADLTLVGAINLALRRAMADDEDVVAGESLGFVERRRVAVVDVIGFDVLI